MNTKQIHYVMMLAREGSFSRAADALNISQPSLSQYIKKIEGEMGLQLFDRTGGDVRLTDAGRAYLDAGRQILDIEHRMEAKLSDIAGHKAGSLIVGTAPYRAAAMLPFIARAFQQVYPGIHLVVREGTTAELFDGLEHGEYDMALTLQPVDKRLFEGCKVTEEELILAVPADRPPFEAVFLPDRRYHAVSAEVLNGQSLVMLTEGQFMQRQLKNLIADHHLTVETAAVVKSLEAQIAMVRQGVGLALAPTGIERFCAPHEVTFYSFIEALPRREVVLIWRREQPLSQAARALKDVIMSHPW